MKKLLLCFVALMCTSFVNNLLAQNESDSVEVVIPLNQKEENNRNVMLNAENSTGPRTVNIGLPFRGDLIIAENGVPVVYYFFPTNPMAAWRNDNSLSRMGMLSFEEGALLYGKVGNPVRSFTRDASRRFKGYATIGLSSNGTSRYDMTLTGPLNKNGWGYMFSAYKNFDRGNGINYQFTDWYDNTTMFKVGLQKDYKKGQVKILYKYVDARLVMSNYVPLRYEGEGEFSELDNFDLGKDSYIPGSGLIPYKDAYGNVGVADLDDDKHNRSISHNLYLVGDHKFDNGWNLDYSALYQDMNSPMSVIFPISTLIDPEANDGIGSQYTINQLIPQSECNMFNTRFEFTKNAGNHRLRAGLQYQNYHRVFESLAGSYYMTVEANPRIYAKNRATGAINYFDGTVESAAAMLGSSNGKLTDDQWSKTAVYFSDDFSVGSRIDLSLGARVEHQNFSTVHDQYNSSNEIISGDLLEADMNNKFNMVGISNLVYKFTSDFGFLADASYNSAWEMTWDYLRGPDGTPIAAEGNPYPRTTEQGEIESVVTKYGGGFYYNIGSKLNIVSKVTAIEKTNVSANETTFYNPVDHPLAPAVRNDFGPEYYDIQTLGWTTDIMAKPFKNFDIHFLVTLQDPKYKNYSIDYAFEPTTLYGMTVPGSEGTYDYSEKQVTGLSKVLLEIDPSYKLYKGKLKAWVSLRYFGKQYGNALNTIEYSPWWESFGGLDYTMSRNVVIQFKVTNFLDQRGIKGDLVNAMQMTQEPVAGTGVVASAIRPRQYELTIDFKF